MKPLQQAAKTTEGRMEVVRNSMVMGRTVMMELDGRIVAVIVLFVRTKSETRKNLSSGLFL
jgi:hypothetical protein